MSTRKTVPVATLIATANQMLRDSVPDARTERLAISSYLETILLDVGAYKGFRYCASEYLPAAEQTDGNVLRPGYDHTRRQYYGGAS